MQNYVMAIDQGTTSTRAILFDQQSNIIGIAQKELENYYPHPGWVEQNANDIWASTVGVMFEVLSKIHKLRQSVSQIKEKQLLSGIRKADSPSILPLYGNLGKAILIVKHSKPKA